VQTTENIGFALSSQSTIDLGIDLSTAFAASANAQAATIDATASGTVTAASSVVMVTGAAIANINVGAQSSASTAIFEVNGNANVAVNAWTNNAAVAKVDNQASLTIGWLTTGNAFFSVWNNATTASAVTFGNIDFTARSGYGTAYGNGIVHVAGGSCSVNASGVTGSGTLRLTGGASISSTGSASASLPQSLTIDISAQGSSGPVAVVDASKTLSISGDITGDAGGVLSVNGNLMLGSTTANVNPQVIVNGGAMLAINSAAAFRAKAVSVASSATLQLGASTQAMAQQGKVMIDQMSQCLGTIQINLATTASAFASANSGGAAVAFNYSSTNNAAELAKCTVQVVDSAGVKYTLTSTTSASAGRRLLSNSNTATWGSNGMSYSMSGQSNGAAPSFAVLPLVVIGFLGLLM
jgi:hypothetical protein